MKVFNINAARRDVCGVADGESKTTALLFLDEIEEDKKFLAESIDTDIYCTDDVLNYADEQLADGHFYAESILRWAVGRHTWDIKIDKPCMLGA